MDSVGQAYMWYIYTHLGNIYADKKQKLANLNSLTKTQDLKPNQTLGGGTCF